MSDVQAMIVAAVERELAEVDAAIAAARDLPARTGRADRTGSAVSVVFTLRLDRDELGALQRRAAVMGLKPSVLARNLIRVGLAGRTKDEVRAAAERVSAAVAGLRALTG